MENSVTFIVKATNDKNRVMRCLASINRQQNKNYKVLALCSLKAAKEEIEKLYPQFETVKIKKAVSFVDNLNKYLPKIDTEYFVIVNFDEILSPDTVDLILNSKSDATVFNISALKGTKFLARYSTKAEWTLAEYMREGLTLWNNAFRSKVVIENSVSLGGLEYCAQSVFLLKCYSYSETIKTDNTVLAYREKLMKKKRITYEEFLENVKDLKGILKRISKKEMFDEKEQIIGDFVVAQLGDMYKEKSFFKRAKKKRLLKRMIGI